MTFVKNDEKNCSDILICIVLFKESLALDKIPLENR